MYIHAKIYPALPLRVVYFIVCKLWFFKRKKIERKKNEVSINNEAE